ncbi:pertactin-like passenger domain-containing protein, partial [Succinatimonas hippei]|uniref:pertactin-like passenger domain-containing protein n=1 Tax=Succinatimonas hippei TaxID=626938 RepID=UPI0026ECDFEE
MSWGGVKTLSKACAVPLLLSPVFITPFALAADPSSTPNEPIEITKGESYTDIVGQDVNILDSDRSWISNTDGTFSGSWDSVNFSTLNNKIINNVSIDNLATTNITIKGNSEAKLTNNVNNDKVYGFYNRNGNLTLEQEEASKVDVSINNTSSSRNRTTYGIFNVNKVYGQADKIYDEILGDMLDVSAVQTDSKVVLELQGTLSLNVQDEQEKGTQYGLYGIYSSLYNYCGTEPPISQEIQSYEKNLETNIEADSISINTKVKSGTNSAIYAESSIEGKVTGENNIVLESKKGDINIQVTNGTIIRIDGSPTNKTEVNLKSAKDNIFVVSNDISYSAPFRAALLVGYGKLNVQTDNGINKLESTNNLQAIEVAGGDVCLKGKENIISAQGGGITLLSKPRTHNDKGLYQNKTEIIATQGNNSLSAVRSGLNSDAETTLIFDAKLGNNIIKAIDTDPALSVGGNSSSGIVYSTGGCISLLANEDSGWNIISPNSENVSENNLFNLAAIRARSEKQTDDNQIYLKAYANKLLGSVVSEDVSKITVDGTKNYISSGSWREIINKGTYSYAVMTMNSAHGTPKININASEAGINEIKVSDVYSGLGNPSERVVYAADKGVININGTSNISTASWIDENAEGYQYNSTSMALVAAATEDAGEFVEDPNSLTDDDRSHINLNYGKGSTITGDIVSGYGGDIQITEQASVSTASARAIAPAMTIRGNVLAGNGGKLNLELGEGSLWYGRADDYQDAGEDHGAESDNSFYNPAFSNEITSSGTVDVKLATNATWKMLGQSWLTSLENNGVVDLSNEFVSSTTGNEVSIENTHALTVQELKGNGTFVMSLDHTDHATSDMLYAKNATGTYTLQLKEMPNGWENIDKDNALRFATLQGGATFNPEVEVVNQGAQNYKLFIEARPYEVNDEENAEYNGDGGLTLAKPGQENVDDFFELSEDKGEEITTASLAKVNEESVDALAEETADSAASEINNFVISQAVSTGLSDIGRTILNMSRANYANAVYMDTLNKR